MTEMGWRVSAATASTLVSVASKVAWVGSAVVGSARHSCATAASCFRAARTSWVTVSMRASSSA